MIDWALIRCAFGFHDWWVYREGVLACRRCTHLKWVKGAVLPPPEHRREQT